MIAYYDAHCDTLTRFRDLGSSPATHLDLTRLGQLAPAAAQVYALWAAPGVDKPRTFRRLMKRLERQLEKHSDKASLCRSVAEADAAAAAGKVAVFAAVEGSALLGCSVAGLTEAHRRGIRLVTLCWNRDNKVCGAAFDSGSGLRENGRRFVEACWNLGVAVDLSHASEQTFWDVLAMASRPVICTHSNAKALCEHPRNLTDDQIRAMEERSCLIGLNFADYFLRDDRNATFDDLRRHIDRFLDLGAEDCLALGSDYDGAEIPPWLDTPEKEAGMYSQLVSAGYPAPLCDKLFFQNALTFFRNNWN